MFLQTEISKVYNILLVTLFTKCIQSSSFQITIKVIIVSKRCKVEHDDSQTFVNLNDRGGLWKVNKEMQGIFIECENIFRARTSTFQTSIDSTSLVCEMLQNCHVLSYKLICYGVEPKVLEFIFGGDRALKLVMRVSKTR